MTRAEIALVTACWLAHRDAKRKRSEARRKWKAQGPKHASETVLWPWSPGPDIRQERAA